MFRKTLAVILAVLMTTLSCASSAMAQNKEPVEQARAAQPLSKKEIKRAKKIRKLIKSLGTGSNARTEVRYANKTLLKGYVSEATDDYFVMTDETGAATRIEYSQVEKVMTWPTVKTLVRRDMSSPSRLFKKLAIGTAIGLGVLFAACGITRRCQN